jgi:CubicO group peptidase (beta-lactamase class C family)
MRVIVFIAAVPLFVAVLTAAAGELPRAEPREVKLSAEKLATLKPALEALVDAKKMAGAVALVARHGKVAYVESIGYRDLAGKTPMTDDTIFAIASMTKPITCVAVMMLVEEGKLGLDDPVGKYLPALKEMRVIGDAKDDTDGEIATVPAKRQVTVRDLLSHTAGFSYGAALLSPSARLDRSYDKAGVGGGRTKTIAELVERLGRVPLAHQPGEGWTYGFSHDVLGRLIEVVSGQSFDAFLQDRIFKPLDMHDTFFLVPESKRERVATIYRKDDAGKLNALPKNYGSATFFSGGGGLFSTARDYSRFAQMLKNGGELEGFRIIKPETIAEMTTNQIGKKFAFIVMKYGLGFGLGQTSFRGQEKPVLHRYFWAGVYSTHFWIDPRNDVVAVIMTQVLPTNSSGADGILLSVVNSAIEK